MKNLKWAAMLTAAVLTGLGFTACGNDGYSSQMTTFTW